MPTTETNFPELERAAMWLADQNPPPRLTVPELRARFGLTAKESCEAIAMVHKFRTARENI